MGRQQPARLIAATSSEPLAYYQPGSRWRLSSGSDLDEVRSLTLRLPHSDVAHDTHLDLAQSKSSCLARQSSHRY